MVRMQARKVALLIVACFVTASVAQECAQRYNITRSPPLLFGGVADASRCKANCQSRDTYWCVYHAILLIQVKLCSNIAADNWCIVRDQY